MADSIIKRQQYMANLIKVKVIYIHITYIQILYLQVYFYVSFGKMFRQALKVSHRRVIPSIARTTRLAPILNRTSPNLCISTRSYALSTEGEDVDSKVDSLSLGQYNNIANKYLETLGDELEMLSEDYPQIDCELTQGVMTLSVPPNGTYVINKQPPNRQIWLSSPISGPKRYDLIGGKWITLRDGSALTTLLEEEISAALEEEFHFEGIEA